MTVLPIVARELRVRSRDKNTWRIRAFAGGAAFLIGAPLLLFSQPGGGIGISGQQFFYVLTGLILVFCLFEGARQTADCISGERRDGTLGLLFLTDLKGYDIVLGKLAVSSINSFFGLFAVFPILSLGLLAGGVTVGEFWRMTLALVTALTFSLAIGIWVSTRNTDERRAILMTVVLLGAIVGGLPLLDTILGRSKEPIFSLASPVTGCFLAADYAYGTGPGSFWMSQVTIIACAVAALVHCAIAITPLAAEEAPARVRASRWHRTVGRRHSIEQDPIAWLASANSTIPRAIIALLCVSTVFAIWQLYEVLSAPPPAPGTVTLASETWMISIVVNLLVWFLLAYFVSDFFLQLRRTGFLELLLVTPQSSAALIRGHREAMWTMLRWPAVLCLATSVLANIPTWVELCRAQMLNLLVQMVVAEALNVPAILLTLVALTYAGAWFGLTSRRTAHALGKVITSVVVLPYTLGIVIWMTTVPTSTSVVPAVMLIFNTFFVIWAGKRLKYQFREAAVRQITGEPPTKPTEPEENPVTEYFGLVKDPR